MASEIEGLERLVAKLGQLAAKARTDEEPVVAVGFSTAYALIVHENMDAKHPVGQAKYLEQPFRQLKNDGTLGDIVLQARRQGKTMAQALLLAGLRIQREAQKLTPVDTGALKGSAFTVLE